MSTQALNENIIYIAILYSNSNEDIMWVIWSKPDNSDKNALQLEVEDAHLEDSNCIYDYVEVDDGVFK